MSRVQRQPHRGHWNSRTFVAVGGVFNRRRIRRADQEGSLTAAEILDVDELPLKYQSTWTVGEYQFFSHDYYHGMSGEHVYVSITSSREGCWRRGVLVRRRREGA